MDDFEAKQVSVVLPGWKIISPDNYTATPASTFTVTMGIDMTSLITAGDSIEYTMNGDVYYGQVKSIASNLLTVRGAPLSVDIEQLRYGGGTITELFLPVNGYYEDASSSSLLLSDNMAPLFWEKQKSYAIYYKVWSRVHDSHATHGKASVYIDTAELNTSTGGLVIAANATWYETVVGINTGNYEIEMGDNIEVTSTKGGTGDAIDLVVILVIVTP